MNDGALAADVGPASSSGTASRSESGAERLIEAWFGRVGQADLKLPDRYFGGRPGENLHELSFPTARPRKLLLELDERQLLVFTGMPFVEERELPSGSELVLSGFAALTFERHDYDSSEPRIARYGAGEVVFGFLGRLRR